MRKDLPKALALAAATTLVAVMAAPANALPTMPWIVNDFVAWIMSFAF